MTCSSLPRRPYVLEIKKPASSNRSAGLCQRVVENTAGHRQGRFVPLLLGEGFNEGEGSPMLTP